ncbi:MAG: hypothetical protein CO094_04265 [Anaerolineae bacterium CG_4_9_14_3_um_filter_57_17]|nr:hypothetical protein [bacterium]NCT21395.1 hypothetical protein [bacterium]OIO83190.1 MAG: hypothetical protein AUK01_13500 [Anaerolineae bacterium CG2_30_57_67]PJB67412.1 MAG: hypothetical protein CO094_04265 [Anaerolineae bacterium CG_4_9_14_3_um_filter_57_17]
MNPVLRQKLTNFLKYVVPGMFFGAMALGMLGAPAVVVGVTASLSFLAGAFFALLYASVPVRPERNETGLTLMMRQVYGYSLTFVLFLAFLWIFVRAFNLH